MKTLIIYFSNTGMVKRIAELSSKIINADLFEIKPEIPYSSNMWKAWDRAKADREQNKLPQLSTSLPDLAEYDNIVIGIPV